MFHQLCYNRHMSFHEQSFATRFAKMGDECETVFETVHDGAWDRYGLNRPDSSMKQMPARVRNTPDYVTSNGFVECKGVGRDQQLKIKLEVLNCMWFWHQTWDLRLFIWDSYQKRYAYVGLDELNKQINNPNGQTILDRFDKDSQKPKAYFGINLGTIGTTWVTATDQLGLAA